MRASATTRTGPVERRCRPARTRPRSLQHSHNYWRDSRGPFSLIRRTPNGTSTLYLPGQEISKPSSGATTTKRYYSLGSINVAVRDSVSGQVTYLLGDQLGSTSVAVNATTGAVATQRFLPYGGARGTGSIGVTDKGWIGQTKDASTGLQYLNARYYDPAIGRFAAVDPLADLSSPGSLDGYGYAHDSPVTGKDPTGLRPTECNDTAWDCSGSNSGGWSVTPKPPAARANPPVCGDVGFVGPCQPPVRPEPPGSVEAVRKSLDQLIHDYLDDALEGYDDVGNCGHAQAVAAIGATGSICDVSIDGQDASLLTDGLSFGHEGLAAGAGRLFSNAEEPDDLGGAAICLSGGYSAGIGGSVTGCASLNPAGVPTGFYSIYLAGEISTPGPSGQPQSH